MPLALLMTLNGAREVLSLMMAEATSGSKHDMVAGGVTVEDLAAAYLQAAGFGVDERAGRVARIDAVDVAVREADFAAALDAGETDAMARRARCRTSRRR